MLPGDNYPGDNYPEDNYEQRQIKELNQLLRKLRHSLCKFNRSLAFWLLYCGAAGIETALLRQHLSRKIKCVNLN